MKKITSGHIIVSFISTLIFFVAVTGLWGMYITKEGSLEESKIVNIPRGASVGQIAQVLEKEGVIGNRTLFKLSAKMMFASTLLQAGSYEFDAKTSLRDVIKKIERGDVVSYKLTIPEGLTSAEVLAKINAASHLVGDDIVEVEEGTLLPETYQYSHGEKKSQLLARMQKAMNKALDEAWTSMRDDVPLNSAHELLTLASIVEKETAVDSERAEIAGVFVNRLNKGMRLQSDPTVIYGASDYDGNIRRKHLRENHPYNTYVIKGLPKGPISNPGKASLMAVANPNVTENLFFVASPEGGSHVFAKTNEEHNRNVREYLAAYKEKYGKK